MLEKIYQINKMTEEKTEIKKQRQCIVKDRGYNSYYYGGATFGSDMFKAIVYNEDEIPEHIKNNPSENQIIFLDTKEGLELLFKEYENLQHYVEIYEARVNEAKNGMEKLFEFENLRKYIELYNKAYHPIIGISEDYKNKLLEEVVKS